MKNSSICFICGAYPPVNDGIGDYTSRLIESLRKEKFRINLITTDEGEDFKRQGDIFSIIKKWNIFGVICILRLINKKRFDIIHIQFPSVRYQHHITLGLLPLFVRIFFRDIKTVITLHEYSVSYPVNKLRQFFLAMFSHRVIVTDEDNFDRLCKILPWGKKKVTVIPIGTNIDVYKYDINERDVFVKRFGLRPETKIILFFGVIHPNKGVECLLESIEILQRDNFPVYLIIISQLDRTNIYHRKIKRIIESDYLKGVVLCTGYLPPDEISRYFFLSDLCVLPFTDGITFRRGTFMAAISHGVPVISTKSDRYIPRELVNGENIVLVPVGDAVKLSEAIKDVCGDERLQKRLKKNIGKLSERFSGDRISHKHTELYTELLKQR